MNRMKKYIGGALVATMVLAGALALANPANATTTEQLTSSDLGIQFADATGLGTKDIRTTVASIINVAMGLLGIVAVVIILIGGFTWMTAGGNEDKVAEAKKWIFAGVIGLAIILSAYALSKFIIDSLVTATTDV